MASFRTQMLAWLVILGCLATLIVSHPAPQEEDSGRSADEVKSDQPKIEPVNKAGLTRPWSVPQLQDTPATQDKKDKRSAEETKETPKGSFFTTTALPPKTLDSANTDKKDKRETEPIAPARLPTNSPTTTPTKINTPAYTRPAVRPAARPEAPTSDKKDKRGVEAVKEAEKTPTTPQQAARPVKTEQPNTGDKKEKRSAEEATKLPETKPWHSRPEVTTEQVKTSARPVSPSRHD